MSGPSPRSQLSFSLGQQQRLAARQLASLEVLALPAGELEAHLRSAYEGNEALVLREPERPNPSGRHRDRSRAQGGGDEHAAWLASLAAPGKPWREALGDGCPDGASLDWLDLLLEHLDDDGWLRASDELLLERAGERGLEGGVAALGRAIGSLQALEPRGIGGRCLEEVLLLQLDPSDPDYRDLCALIEHHLADLAHNRLPRIARALGVALPRLEHLRGRLARLDPRPARGLSGTEAQVLRPDLRLVWNGETMELEVAGDSLPALTLDPRVASLVKDPAQSRADRQRLQESLVRARALLSALEQRAATLRRVAECVLRRQPGFLAGGPSQLVPLQQAEVAEELGLHPSTVSRAIAGKSIETPFGVLRLAQLFAASAPGGEASAETLREALRQRVAAEDQHAPLSDEDLAAELARGGLPVARRTVAKLREELGIASSYLRRRFAA